MNRVIRYGIGAMTSIVFLTIGLNLIGSPEGQRIGAALAGLGVFRAVFLIRQYMNERAEEDEEAR